MVQYMNSDLKENKQYLVLFAIPSQGLQTQSIFRRSGMEPQKASGTNSQTNKRTRVGHRTELIVGGVGGVRRSQIMMGGTWGIGGWKLALVVDEVLEQ